MKPTYEELTVQLANTESKCMDLAAENAGMKAIVDFVTDLDNEPQYHEAGMGCGLEDRGITDRYEAMRHGWDNAMERIYGEVIPCADEIAFPATSAFLAEVRAQARNEFINELESRFNEMTETLPPELRSGAAGAAAFVSTFRKGAAL